MLDILSDGFSRAKQFLSGKATLTAESLLEPLEQVRRSLLEADVEYGVAKAFVEGVRSKLLGQEVQLRAGSGGERLRVTPEHHFVKACQEELEALMGPIEAYLNLPSGRVASVMMVGLQGSGKTTTTAKICHYLIHRKKRKPMLVAADIYRAAAVDQLKVLGTKLGVPVFHKEGASPVVICREALAEAARLNCDTVLFDTAGRLTIDEELMKELTDIKSVTSPDNILFVIDAMMGQDAVTTAKAFDERLAISGVVMTKFDGDARGGAALSVKQVVGKPIKFLGVGESIDKLEEFRPESVASRVLGMGDVLGLMEDFERVAEGDEEEKAMRMLQGQFSFNDFYKQISMIQKMGSLKDLAAKLPMQGLIPKDANFDDAELTKIKSMIDSMTPTERIKPGVLNGGRVRRIAMGSGRSQRDVQDLIQKFSQMRKMMGMLGKNMGGLLGKIPGLGGMAQMRQMAQSMMGGGGMAGLQQMMGAGGMGGKPAASFTKKKMDKDRAKKLKKLAKKAKQKNRRK